MNQFSSLGDIECTEIPMGSAGATCWVASVCLGDVPSDLLKEALKGALLITEIPGALEVEEEVEVLRVMGDTENRARRNLNEVLLQAQIRAVSLLQDLQDLCPLTHGRD